MISEERRFDMLQVYSTEKSKEWDELVRSFSNHDVYHLSGYAKAFEIHGDGKPHLFYYEGDGVRGINVVMKRDIADDARFSKKIPHDTYFDLITPYGYGGWLIEGDGNTEMLFSEYEKWAIGNNVVSEFVRYHPMLDNAKFSEAAYDVIPLGGTIAIDISSQETIWENITSKNRNMIRKAEKNGITIHMGRSPELFEIFREIYNATMDKDNADSYYYFSSNFYESVKDDLPDNSQVFYAVYEDKIIATSIILFENRRLNYHLSGSVREYQNLAPTNLLLYRVAMWGCENGYKTFHLGGGVGSGEDSLFKFKKSFYRGEPYRYHIGKKIFLPKEYDELLALREDVPQTGFFPKYRA